MKTAEEFLRDNQLPSDPRVVTLLEIRDREAHRAGELAAMRRAEEKALYYAEMSTQGRQTMAKLIAAECRVDIETMIEAAENDE